MLKPIRYGVVAAALLSSASAFASCGDLSKAFFGVEIAGPRAYLTAMPEGFRVETLRYRNSNPQYPDVGGRDTLWGESHGISHAASLDWWRDQRVMRIQDQFLTTSRRTLEHYREIVSGVAGIPFEYDAANDWFALDCEPELSVHMCSEDFPEAARPQAILVIEHEQNDAMFLNALAGPDGSAPPPGTARGPVSPCVRPPPGPTRASEIERAEARARGESAERGPIFESALTPAEVEQELALLRERLLESDVSPEIVADVVARGRAYYAETPAGFKTADKLSLFPEISATDEFLYMCTTRFRIPPVHDAYASIRTDAGNGVDIKTISCRTQIDEMYCSLLEERALTLGDVEQFFFVDETMDEAEGLAVAALYLEAEGSWNELNRIAKQGDEYVLEFGRRGCACTVKRLARILDVQGERRLEIDDAFEQVCV